jgi:hypothetical protein
MKDITAPPWRVAKPIDLDLTERSCAGKIVISGPPKSATLIADCRNDTLPLSQVLANAALVGKATMMAEVLIRLEEEIGDLPHSKTADVIYSIVRKALSELGITPRENPDLIG